MVVGGLGGEGEVGLRGEGGGGHFEGESVGVEAFGLVYLWFAVYFEGVLILTVVDLNYSRLTLEYYGPTYISSTFLSTANLTRYSASTPSTPLH